MTLDDILVLELLGDLVFALPLNELLLTLRELAYHELDFTVVGVDDLGREQLLRGSLHDLVDGGVGAFAEFLQDLVTRLEAGLGFDRKISV